MSSDRRKPAACIRCHKKKIKCSGGVSCQNCQNVGASCIFPTRNRNIVVSEAYIRQLQAVAQTHTQSLPSIDSGSPEDTNSPRRETSNRANPQSRNGRYENRAAKLTLKHATAEAFVSGLKKLKAGDYAGSPIANPHTHQASQSEFYSTRSNEVPNYDYVSLISDASSINVSIQLPPYPYAVQLVSQFECFMAFEYHWYLRQEFHSDLEATYQSPGSPRSRNHTWLCKLLAVLALGESFNGYEPPLIDLSQPAERPYSAQEKDTKRPYLPGARFFEQALSLFKMPSEEPEIEHVEALNLISFFCYSLNRRKTAYMYAGISTRIANSLMLHMPAETEAPTIAEHRKRVWWTTFLMDAMISSEMGLRAAFGFAQAEHSLPSDEQLTLAQRNNFWDSEILAAHIKLCNIRTIILETIAQLQDTDFSSYEMVVEVPLRELEAWKRELPPALSFDFSNRVPEAMLAKPSMRSLASCYLRYHQGYILLIRPVFFKLLGIVLGNDTDMSSINGLLNLSSRCLEAAKCNMRILTTLSSKLRLARYGFYDSLHLFSSIKIFSLSRLVNTIRPLCLIQEPQDLSLYSAARDLLLSMATCGNLAAKGHMQMLEDIERLLDVVSQSQDAQPSNFRLEEIFPWIDSIGGSTSFLDMAELPHMPDGF